MRWEDERYVRIYTRDTADWLALSFDAQALFVLLLRKVDRAGLLRLGKHGRRAVAVVLGQVAAWPRLEAALAELLADGCVRLEGEVLVVPNFIEAQEAAMSDRQRKAEQRARARDQATPPRDEVSRNVTGSHEPSREVTGGPAESQEVTPSRAVPCRAEPEEAAAARARARDGAISMTGLGVAEASSPPPVAEAAPGPTSPTEALLAAPPELEPTSTATGEALPSPAARQASAIATDAPALKPLLVLDTTEIGILAAEVRARVERAGECRLIVAAPERKADTRARSEAAVQVLGVERAVEICTGIVARRKRHGIQPPKAWAYFVDPLEEAVAGGNPCPPEIVGVDLDQVAEAEERERAGRWVPLLERMPPSVREAFEADKARMLASVRSQGLWTSEERRQLEQAEEFLWTKWTKRLEAAGGA